MTKPAADEYEMPKTYTAEEVKKHKGDLKHGEAGWVKLDENGCPSGAATKEPPKDGPAIAVVAHTPAVAVELTTSSGAPITENMNPQLPQPHIDEGMLARNPPAKAPAKEAAPAPAKK